MWESKKKDSESVNNFIEWDKKANLRLDEGDFSGLFNPENKFSFQKYSWNLMQTCSKINMDREGMWCSLIYLKRLVFSTKGIKTSPYPFYAQGYCCSVQSLSPVWPFETPWAAARQAPLSPLELAHVHVHWTMILSHLLTLFLFCF